MLVVIDGFGIGRDPAVDAIAAARHAALARRCSPTWPHCRLDASGPAVGLPAGQMGNSEVGHLNLGAGRPVLQDLPRIDAAIADGSFAGNPALLAAAATRRRRRRRLHLVGLIGPGRRPLDRSARCRDRRAWRTRAGVGDVVVHGLLDGRDTPPRSADAFMPDFEARLAEAHPGARIATIGGRYYGMDRDKRWERDAGLRTRRWSTAAGFGDAGRADASALAAATRRGENDEFVAADASSTAWTAASATATSSSTSTSAPTARAS